MNASQRNIKVESGRTDSDNTEDIADNVARQQYEQAQARKQADEDNQE